jgi:hypothetical protein
MKSLLVDDGLPSTVPPFSELLIEANVPANEYKDHAWQAK